MLLLNKILALDKSENQRRNYIWNTAAGLLNAAEAVILSMAITRITNLNDAGILTIAFATANLFVTLGKFGVRNYQVTDTTEKFSFSTYFRMRVITAMIMIIVSLGYCVQGIIIKDYSLYKAGSIFCMCMIYVIEAVEDVFCGKYQKMGRLDIGGKIFLFRWCGILLTYIISMLIWKNLLFASVMALVVSCVIFVITIRACEAVFRQSREKESDYGLIRQCMPLCLSSFLSYYICNSSKYAIDRYLTDEEQACFGFVAMPVFVIGLLSGFLYQPTISQIALEWSDKKYAKIQNRIRNQILFIVIVSVLCIIGAYFWGIPVLSLLYRTDLESYKFELLLMVSGGGCLAAVNYVTMILTIMRKQTIILIIYFIFAMISIVLSACGVQYGGTSGGAFMYMGIMLVMAIVLIIFTEICIYRKNLIRRSV